VRLAILRFGETVLLLITTQFPQIQYHTKICPALRCFKIFSYYIWLSTFPETKGVYPSVQYKFKKYSLNTVNKIFPKELFLMLSKSMQTALNNQIQAETFSSYAYLAMSAYCAEQNYAGFANWFRVQSSEEWAHAMKFYDYILDRGGNVRLQPIDEPPFKYKSPLEVFSQALAHEKKVTGLITKLYELALKENDYPTQIFLQWFITEQVEEENTAQLIVNKLELIGDSIPGMLYLDKELGKRATA